MKDYKELENDMILRDYLAYDRTKMALIRTFLSIARTALGLLASGVGLVILQGNPGVQAIGYFIVAVSLVVFIIGSVYCYKVKKKLDELE